MRNIFLSSAFFTVAKPVVAAAIALNTTDTHPMQKAGSWRDDGEFHSDRDEDVLVLSIVAALSVGAIVSSIILCYCCCTEKTTNELDMHTVQNETSPLLSA